MVGAMKDISKQKSEELHLKLLESVITHLNDSVVITDASKENKIVYVNDAFTKMTGYSSDESIGKNPSMLQGPKSDKSEIQKIKMAINNYESCEITTINYKKNGKNFGIIYRSAQFQMKKEILHTGLQLKEMSQKKYFQQMN